MILKDILKKSIVILCLLVPLIGFSRQTVLDKKISLQAHNESIANVLHRIEQLAGVNFMYMSGLFDKNRIVSISFTNTSIKIILQKVIPSNDVLLYVIDNKIIFYRKDEAPPGKDGTTYLLTPTETIETPKPITEAKRILIDTIKVSIFDTVTVTKYDTIRVVEKLKELEKPSTKSIELSKPITSGFILSVFWGEHFIHETVKANSRTDISTIIKTNEKGVTIRPEYGIGLRYQWSHFSINSGIGMVEKQWNTDYSFTKIFTDSSKITGYIETISWNVTPHKPQPGPPPQGGFQLFDSTKIITKTPIYKKDSTQIKYKGTNKASYLSVPLILSFHFTVYKKLYATIGSGITLYLLRNAVGYTIKDSNYTLVHLNEILKDYYISSSSECGLGYSVSKHQIIWVKAGMHFSITKLQKENFPISKQERSFSGMISWGWKF
jgi:hypothetical protein